MIVGQPKSSEAEVEDLYMYIFCHVGGNVRNAARILEATYEDAVAGSQAVRTGTIGRSEWLRGLAHVHIAELPAQTVPPEIAWRIDEDLQTLFSEIDVVPLSDALLSRPESRRLVCEVLATLPDAYLTLLRQTPNGQSAEPHAATDAVRAAQLRSAHLAFRETLASRFIHLALAPVRNEQVLEENLSAMLAMGCTVPPLDEETRLAVADTRALAQSRASDDGAQKLSNEQDAFGNPRAPKRRKWWLPALLAALLCGLVWMHWSHVNEIESMQRTQQLMMSNQLIADGNIEELNDLAEKEKIAKRRSESLPLLMWSYPTIATGTDGLITPASMQALNERARAAVAQVEEKHRLKQLLDGLAYSNYARQVISLNSEKTLGWEKVFQAEEGNRVRRKLAWEARTQDLQRLTNDPKAFEQIQQWYRVRFEQPDEHDEWWKTDLESCESTLAELLVRRDDFIHILGESRCGAVIYLQVTDVTNKASSWLIKRLAVLGAEAEFGLTHAKTVQLKSEVQQLETELDALLAEHRARLTAEHAEREAYCVKLR